MDQSKIRNAGAEMVRTIDELLAADGRADVVIVDLGRPGVLEVIPRLDSHVVGFGRHTETDLLRAAEEAGCDEVVVRSVFFSRLQTWF
ncbi:MAG: hypothetical protein ACR2PK_15685 [Acidimicrobiales bacterium]